MTSAIFLASSLITIFPSLEQREARTRHQLPHQALIRWHKGQPKRRRSTASASGSAATVVAGGSKIRSAQAPRAGPPLRTQRPKPAPPPAAMPTAPLPTAPAPGQIAANEPIPPVRHAITMTNPVRESAMKERARFRSGRCATENKRRKSAQPARRTQRLRARLACRARRYKPGSTPARQSCRAGAAQ